MSHINNLPNEILFGIFQLLSPKDLKAAVLTCKLWRDWGEDPSLWRWSVVGLGSNEDLPKLYIQRLQLLQEIKITHGLGKYQVFHQCFEGNDQGCHWSKNGMSELFESILEIPTVTRINGFDFCEGLAAVEPNLLVSVLNRLERLELMDLAPEKVEILLTAMAKKTKLKDFRVIEQFESLREINPELLASAISNVDEVALHVDDFSFQLGVMVETLFSAIISEERPLKKFTFDASSAYDIDPDMFGKALNRLEEVTVTSFYAVLSLEQVNAIIKHLVDGESKLKRLELEGPYDSDRGREFLEQLDIDLVKRSSDKLGEVGPGHFFIRK